LPGALPGRHLVGLLCAFRAIHHSSNEFNHSAAARGIFLDGLPRPPESSHDGVCRSYSPRYAAVAGAL
jgi:hypothetical protein